MWFFILIWLILHNPFNFSPFLSRFVHKLFFIFLWFIYIHMWFCFFYFHMILLYSCFIFIHSFISTCTLFTWFLHNLFCLFIYFDLWSFPTLYFYFHTILLYSYMIFCFTWVIHFSQLITWCHVLLEFTYRRFRA